MLSLSSSGGFPAFSAVSVCLRFQISISNAGQPQRHGNGLPQSSPRVLRTAGALPWPCCAGLCCGHLCGGSIVHPLRSLASSSVRLLLCKARARIPLLCLFYSLFSVLGLPHPCGSFSCNRLPRTAFLGRQFGKTYDASELLLGFLGGVSRFLSIVRVLRIEWWFLGGFGSD